jgi:hypothetical protein
MRSILPAPPEVHGTYNGYNNYRCRCEPCRQAASVYLRARYRRRIRRDKVKTKLGISWSRVL